MASVSTRIMGLSGEEAWWARLFAASTVKLKSVCPLNMILVII